MPRQWKEAGKTGANKSKVLFDTYKARGGKDLRHSGIGAVAVKRSSMGHSLSSGVSGAKARVLMSPKALQSMFAAGSARKEPIRKLKKGKPDKNKAAWLECWHIRGNAKIDGKMQSYDFTVVKKAAGFELYDFKIK